ncbi:histidine acid phosphatase [Oesophagostomum dentatum]|uniref:Histidine acid phosphatase n=1 Tax=Oesophagostomum dentatum TaxID=61180 RepID=A0A0B1TI00_OESDE|nr:histidine acid phosphatase [Oesophagostomum dentatum]
MFYEGEPGKDYPAHGNWPHGWTPVPVHTLPSNEDHAGNVFAPCPRADQLDEQLVNSKEYRKIEEENKEFFDFLSEKTGMKVSLGNIYLVHDVHHIELKAAKLTQRFQSIYGLSQPAWLTPNVSDRMRNLTQIANEYTYGIGKPYVPELIRLRGGNGNCFTILMAFDRFEHFHAYFFLRSHSFQHDTTVAALLSTFGDEERVIRGGLPRYTASVAIELWMLDEGPAVRILFHGAFHHNYHTITHLTKGCPVDNEFCPLEMFEERSLQFMPFNINKECQKRERSNKTNQPRRVRVKMWRSA